MSTEFGKDQPYIPNPYQSLSPIELNRALRSVIHQLPSVSRIELLHEGLGGVDPFSNLEKAIELVDSISARRDASIHKQVLLEKIDLILEFAQITAFGKDYIRFAFGEEYAHGQYRGIPSPYGDILNAMLDPNNPESAGIFDPEKARQLEIDSYRKLVREHNLSLRVIDLTFQSMGRDLTQEDIESDRNEPQAEIMRQWRVDIIDRYQTEP